MNNRYGHPRFTWAEAKAQGICPKCQSLKRDRKPTDHTICEHCLLKARERMDKLYYKGKCTQCGKQFRKEDHIWQSSQRIGSRCKPCLLKNKLYMRNKIHGYNIQLKFEGMLT